MTEDNAKSKLTLSGKSTLTLKNVSDGSRAHNNDGKKIVQVEVRKKRVIANRSETEEPKVKIDEATAAKLRLIAEAKEHDAKRRQEEEEKERQRQLRREQEEQEKAQREAEEAKKAAEEKKTAVRPAVTTAVSPAEDDCIQKIKEKKSRDFDEEDEDEE